jgi:hypothetical protein
LLLALIGASINLFLRNIESNRRDVEMAQLARAIFAMIGNDLHAASDYRPQDTSGVMTLAAAAVTDINAVVDGSATGGTGSATGGSATGGSATGGSTTGGSTTGGTTTGSTTGTTSSTTTSTTTTTTTTTIPPGVQGDMFELWVDTSRPPELGSLFERYSGYTGIQQVVPISQTGPGGAAMNRGAITPATDLKVVRYFVRQGQAVDTTTADATSLSPNMQYLGAGLVRQVMDRAERTYADQVGDTGFYEVGQQLIAPEVGKIEFRYFDGTAVLGNWDTALQTWDMTTYGYMPPAIEVRIWLGDPAEMVANQASRTMGTALSQSAREFRHVFFLPIARPAETSTTGTSTTDTGSTGTTTGTTSATGTSP